ncbi:MAG TPA: nucleotide exchange factor GrpE [Nitrospirales bacterium]|jgi:molecular chaperone GrpE
MPEENETSDKSTDYEQCPMDGGGSADTVQSAETQNSSPESNLKAAQDRYVRLAAEFENYKKRTQKDQDEFRKYSNERLLKELLPVLDNLQRALQHGQVSGKHEGVLQGVELTVKKYLDILSRFGVKPIPTLGLPFDPAIHQAVAKVESKGQKPNTIVEEYEKGYYLHDRVLRPATVTVAESPGSDGREPDA